MEMIHRLETNALDVLMFLPRKHLGLHPTDDSPRTMVLSQRNLQIAAVHSANTTVVWMFHGTVQLELCKKPDRRAGS